MIHLSWDTERYEEQRNTELGLKRNEHGWYEPGECIDCVASEHEDFSDVVGYFRIHDPSTHVQYYDEEGGLCQYHYDDRINDGFELTEI